MITNGFITCQACGDMLPQDLECAACALIRMERSRELGRDQFTPSRHDNGTPLDEATLIAAALGAVHSAFQHGPPNEVVPEEAFERILRILDKKKARTK